MLSFQEIIQLLSFFVQIFHFSWDAFPRSGRQTSPHASDTTREQNPSSSQGPENPVESYEFFALYNPRETDQRRTRFPPYHGPLIPLGRLASNGPRGTSSDDGASVFNNDFAGHETWLYRSLSLPRGWGTISSDNSITYRRRAVSASISAV
ncbi:hypothetical protein BU16DRAFT_136844 [Lophium mytilinum]|uniref:Uncharacterized protein n=1 Tax=Lophium mytilinum TaxID=390894 RepID=A0A6A6QER1_9PEZI|nr:hypothetical protein BU16DRAFT_136844 [Lophium mytilinum]